MSNANKAYVPTGLAIPAQIPVDYIRFCPSESILSDLGLNDNLVFTYYDGLIIFCRLERTSWEWRQGNPSETKLLATGYTYPAGWIVDEVNYSNKEYNFYKVVATSLDRIVKSTGFSLAGQDITFNALWKWWLANVFYSNPSAITINIPFSQEGFSRLVYFVPNNANGFDMISGDEVEVISGNPTAPTLPGSGLYATWVEVTDSTISDPEEPVIEDIYVTESEAKKLLSNEDGIVNLDTEETRIVLKECTVLDAVSYNTNPYLYDGRPLFITNQNDDESEIVINHLEGIVGTLFSFPNEQPLILKFKETIQFKLSLPENIHWYVGVIPDDDLEQRIIELENASFPDTVLKYGEILIIDGEAVIAEDTFNWRLDQVDFLNTPAYSVPINEATDNFYRTDLVVGDNTGNYHLVQGTEDAIAAPEPDVPDGMIKLSEIPIFGAIIGLPTVPPNYDDKYLKRYKSTYNWAGSVYDINPGADDYNSILNNSTLSYIAVHPNGHAGKPLIKNGAIYWFKSVGAGDVIVYPGTGVTINAPDGTTLNKNQQCYLIKDDYNEWTLINPRNLQNVDNTSDANKPVSTAQQTALDLKLDAADYNQHFKGVYPTEAALNSAHPTAAVGDYAQVNETGATDVVNYNWDNEDSCPIH